MAQPLRTNIYTTAIIITLIMIGVMIMGARQYQLQKHQTKIISQSENLLFQFSIIREHIIESLLNRRYGELPAIANEVESFNSNITQLMDNSHIPNEYKLNFINQVDLPGLILLLRQSDFEQIEQSKLEQINTESRKLANRLMIFDRMLVNYAKSRLIGFQNVTIGALAIIIFITINLLVLGHRFVATPLLLLLQQVREITAGQREDISSGLRKGEGEVATLAESFHDLIVRQLHTISESTRFKHILFAVHRAGIAISNADNREKLFSEVSRALLFNEDYCLVCIGIPDSENDGLIPLLADGSATATDQRGDACLAMILAESKEKGRQKEPALRALQERQVVLDRDILADIPGGHLKDSPLTDGQADCAALPLIWEDQIYGVISIYSGAEDCFNEEEMKLLAKMASDVAFALHYLEIKNGSTTSGYASRHTTRLAALGELSSGMAHEINNLSNGIINYAQIIVDEMKENGTQNNQSTALEAIISEGERLADIANKLLFYDKNEKQSKEIVSLPTVINDALLLIKYHLKNDGIILNLDIQKDLPALPLQVQDLHIALLIIMNNARRSLNRRFPDKDPSKKLNVLCCQYKANREKFLRVAVTDHGAGLNPQTISQIFEPMGPDNIQQNETSRDLSFCRELIEEEHQGNFAIESEIDNQTTVTIDLPLRI